MKIDWRFEWVEREEERDEVGEEIKELSCDSVSWECVKCDVGCLTRVTFLNGACFFLSCFYT